MYYQTIKTKICNVREYLLSGTKSRDLPKCSLTDHNYEIRQTAKMTVAKTVENMQSMHDR